MTATHGCWDGSVSCATTTLRLASARGPASGAPKRAELRLHLAQAAAERPDDLLAEVGARAAAEPREVGHRALVDDAAGVLGCACATTIR